MTKNAVVHTILQSYKQRPKFISAKSFAPANIALIKYWGKRNKELNLPTTSSLSISLGNLGTFTKITLTSKTDQLILNGKLIDSNSHIMVRLKTFLNLFRQKLNLRFKLECITNIPLAAGLASSSSAFASITKAMNNLFDWKLDDRSLSILARLGSGSACRSLWHGFVQWRRGYRSNGMDSHGIPINVIWQDFNIGLIIFNNTTKEISSTNAMNITKKTSFFYQLWPIYVKNSLKKLYTSLYKKDFNSLAEIAENNSLSMHSMMLTAKPSICYMFPQTIQIFHKIWCLRKKGIQVYLTQDAGPNVKLLFLKKDQKIIKQNFKNIKIIEPFLYNDTKV